MNALLLAGGIGSRLRPITDSVPKCLVPINGRPLLDIWLEALMKAGFQEIVVNTHYLAPQVEAYLADSFYSGQVRSVYEPELLGTAGSLMAYRQWLDRETCLVAHADNLVQIDFQAFLEAHQQRPDDCLMTLLAFETDSPQTCGILELDEQRRVTGFHEKVADPPSNLANGAVYLIEPALFEWLEAQVPPPSDISLDVLPGLMGHCQAWPLKGYLRDIGNPAALALGEREFAALQKRL